MPSSDFGNSDFGYSDAGVAGSGYQAGDVPGQGGIQDSPPGNPGPFGQGQPGYQGTPTPIGYQDPSQFGQPGYGNRQMWSGAGPSGLGAGGGVGRALLSFFVGPGLFGRRGRNSYFWSIRIAFWIIVIGICLYVGFTTHHWITTCTGNNCGD